MIAATEQAVRSTVAQVRTLWAEHGTPLSETAAWAHVGATPMIGQNDVDNEVFTATDAQQLAALATADGLGRVSLWSLNRDTACNATFPGVVVHSTTCSGVKQKSLAFVNAFGDLGSGGPAVHLGNEGAPASGGTVVDNPATSPFPVWRPEGQYPGGYRVVWHGEVYEARWYAASGIDPSLPATTGSPSPWALLGAVTRTDVAPKPVPTVTDVTKPWDPGVLYQRGDRVLFNGLPYEARWASRDTPPGTLFPIGPDEAWAPLFTLPGEPAGS
jgi:chitinase